VLPLAGNYAGLVPGFVVMSLGQGASWTGMWVLVGQGIAPARQGVASGVAATAQQVGAALGLALLVMLAAAPLAGLEGASAETLRQANARGLQHAQWGAAGLALLAWLVCLRMARPQALSRTDTPPVGEGRGVAV
jgi:MFS family permease